MFHVGKGEFIDYQVLSKYVISMVRNGTTPTHWRGFVVTQGLNARTIPYDLTEHAQESQSANQRRALQMRKSHSTNLSMFTHCVNQ